MVTVKSINNNNHYASDDAMAERKSGRNVVNKNCLNVAGNSYGGWVEDAVHGCVFIVLRLADIRHSSFSSKISTLKGAALLTSYASPGHSRITTAPRPPAPPTSSETHTPLPFPLSTPAQPSRRRPAGPLMREEEEED